MEHRIEYLVFWDFIDRVVACQATGFAMVTDESVTLFTEVSGNQNIVVAMTHARANSTNVMGLICMAGMTVVSGL